MTSGCWQWPRPSQRALAVWRRNVLVWRKLMAPSLVGNFGEPLLYLLALGYGLGGFVGQVDGMDYVVFLAAGIVCTSAMNTASYECLYSAYTRMTVQETWAAMLSAPLSLDDIVCGEILWAGTKALINSSAVLLVATALGLVADWQALWVLPLALLLGCCFGAMALVVTAMSPGYDFFLYYFTLVVTPMFLLSGVFFPLTGVPDWVQMGAQLLPLAHGVELVRPLMTGQVLDGALLHLSVLFGYMVLASWVSLILVRRRLLR